MRMHKNLNNYYYARVYDLIGQSRTCMVHGTGYTLGPEALPLDHCNYGNLINWKRPLWGDWKKKNTTT